MTPSGRRSTLLPGARATRQRVAVARLLEDSEDFRTAQQLHDELRRRGEGIALTTVYRTLQPSLRPARWTYCAPIPARQSTAAARASTTIT